MEIIFFQLEKIKLMLWVSNYSPIEVPPVQTSVVGVEVLMRQILNMTWLSFA